ncbi:site-specific integrase [Tenacibaculum singaporense]|uniref:Site-specific integrase n=1 Tax=Tenacibaculum singaporense TaxID=2358479 RepID=A0A3Q8RMF4_9FLAO|nr:site-specific integrase [Tenacibaculum singaporense]AZJ35242.1 site-specific integrase [Tenacibaculum singaporense]
MNNSKIHILFFIQKNRINKRGNSPMRCRITYNKQRKDFSTGLFINPNYWDSKKQKLLSKAENSEIVNTQLSLISQKINEAFLLLQLQQDNFDVDDIYSQYKGENIRTEKTLLELYDLHNNATKALIGIDFNETSWGRYIENKRKVAEFIKHKYKRSDIKLNQLELKFIKDLEYYFKTNKKLSQATINRSLQRLKKIINYGIAENYLDRNPFILHKPTKYKIKLVYLTAEELKDIEEYTFIQPRLQQVKDLFVFCCYTGLAYQEMSMLSEKHIKVGFDGNKWIEMYRKKTGSKISVPILPKAQKILDKYDNFFPKISNQRFNSYLKEILEVLGIEKKLTHHNARKTFATTILLSNGVSMEVVSELLGHSRLQVTQEHYAKVVKVKVSKEINSLKNKIENT